MTKKNDVTPGDIMEFLQEHMVMQGEFQSFKQEMHQFKDEMHQFKQEVKQDMNNLRQEVKQDMNNLRQEVKQDLNKQKLEILDGMDDKLADFKGDLVAIMRKADKKNSVLVTLLAKKKTVTQKEARSILAMPPFPQTA